MKIEGQVTCRELSQQLKKAGYKQEGVWWWQHTETLGVFNAKTEEEKDKYRTTELVLKKDISNMAHWSFVAPTQYWVNIPNTNGLYQISNFGQVKRVDKDKIIVPTITNGYYRVNLSVDNKDIFISPHRVMAQVFLPNPNNCQQVNHKNGNKIANWIENLEWCTAKHNTHHAFDNGLRKRHKRNNTGQFTKEPI